MNGFGSGIAGLRLATIPEEEILEPPQYENNMIFAHRQRKSFPTHMTKIVTYAIAIMYSNYKEKNIGRKNGHDLRKQVIRKAIVDFVRFYGGRFFQVREKGEMMEITNNKAIDILLGNMFHHKRKSKLPGHLAPEEETLIRDGLFRLVIHEKLLENNMYSGFVYNQSDDPKWWYRVFCYGVAKLMEKHHDVVEKIRKSENMKTVSASARGFVPVVQT